MGEPQPARRDVQNARNGRLNHAVANARSEVDKDVLGSELCSREAGGMSRESGINPMGERTPRRTTNSHLGHELG